MAEKERKKSASGRDIGEIPPVANQARRDQCERDLQLFCETYFPKAFKLTWSPDHLRLIKKIQTAVLIGGNQAFAMPRGSGKSTLCMAAIIWATIYGHHRFAMLLCANSDMAGKTLDRVKFAFETNALLFADFPEICYPIRRLERVANRAKGQTYHGSPTWLEWSGEQLVLPYIPGRPGGGAVIAIAGLLEAVRGMLMFHPPTENLIRPTYIMVDDFQTRDSARSIDETSKRVDIITSDLMGMVGPGEDLSVLVPGTIIEPGDGMAQLLDREQFPEFRGETCKLIYKLPDNTELWEEYDVIRRRCLKHVDEDGEEPETLEELYREANEFYIANREAMDAGAEIAWPERKRKHEVSAIQNAMNIFFTNLKTFYTEYQNDPLSAIDSDDERLDQREIALKLSGFDRYVIPDGCQYVTAFVDVHKRVLYYTLAAWTPAFSGYIIDYGAFPKPRVAHFTERTARPTLSEKFPKRGLEAYIYAGLEETCRYLFTRKLTRVDGARLSIGLCLIDSGWKPDPVFKYCAASPYEGRVAPSIGRTIGPNDKQLSRCKPRRGEHIGLEWTIPATHGKEVRQVQFDTYFWKTFFHARLATNPGDQGCLQLFGKLRGEVPDVDHSFYARHLDAEYSLPVTGRQTIDEWRMRPGESQNHYFDTAVGCTVAASVLGANIIETPTIKVPKKGRRVSQEER